jgi:chromosomal replication initiation ATPase DnaA
MLTPRMITYAGIRAICERNRLSREQLMSGMSAKVCRVRREIAYFLHYERKLSTQMIAEILDRDHSSVVAMLRRHREELAA